MLLQDTAPSEEKTWELFQRKASTNGVALHKNIEDIARHIAVECKGLPSAVNAVGTAMNLKKKSGGLESHFNSGEKYKS